jgi:hypothetical protein
MTDDDPVPLKAGGEATPELVRALYALGRSDPDMARLARVAKKLGAAIADAPPPGSLNGVRKLIGTKTLLTALVIGVAALSWLGYQFAGHRLRSTGGAPPPSAAETSSADTGPESNIQDEVVTGRKPEQFANTIAPVDARASAATRRGPRHAVPTQPGNTPRSQSAQTPANPALAPADTSTLSRPDTGAAAAPSEPVAATENKPAEQPKPAPAHEASVAQRSEVELLFDARKFMAAAQPAAALHLLDEHATRFPNGQLGPERDVLMIEALRKLGRTAEANKRLHQFETRYPNSIHLRRLQGDPVASH